MIFYYCIINHTSREETMITAGKLREFAPNCANADEHAAALEAARLNSSVNSELRLCHFLGQIFVESGGLRRLEENLNFKTAERLDKIFTAVRGVDDAAALIARGPEAIGNRIYANRLGNGNEASGDGFRYRGSGYIQLTGRANFRRIGDLVGINIEDDPDQARRPNTAAAVAFAFWDARHCSQLADVGDIEGITERINGSAMLGLAERREATERAMDIWLE
jgi:putative chitinase